MPINIFYFIELSGNLYGTNVPVQLLVRLVRCVLDVLRCGACRLLCGAVRCMPAVVRCGAVRCMPAVVRCGA